jgi:hypothetical protein
VEKSGYIKDKKTLVPKASPYIKKQLITYVANGKRFENDNEYICATLCKAGFKSVAFKHERNPG